jgi:TRAP-type mannitol/chloroaromatic compound transport system permease large subunit
MKHVAPPAISMAQVYRAVTPHGAFELLVLVGVMLYPPLATWLPGLLFGA